MALEPTSHKAFTVSHGFSDSNVTSGVESPGVANDPWPASMTFPSTALGS